MTGATAGDGGTRTADGRRGHGFGFAALFTVLGTVLPGLGLIVAGWRKVGAVVLLLTVATLVVVGVRVGSDPIAAAGSVLGGDRLRTIEVVAIAAGLAWAVVVVCTARALRPPRGGTGPRAAMSALVGVLCLLVLAPTALAASVVDSTHHALTTIFTNGPSATVEQSDAPRSSGDPWAGKARVNVLLLGGDAGPTAGGGIRSGLRTDTVIVASIDTHTGNTVLFSVGRNTQRLAFQPGTPLAEAYPGGYASNPDAVRTGAISENWLDSIYDDVPAQHPGLLGPTANEGADALKLGLGYSLFGDQHAIDYYVLISLRGFQQVVNALGGLTVNVTKPVPIGGSVGVGGAPDTLPTAWIMTSRDRHLDGHDALWFARGRYDSNDRERAARQRCTINALTNQATPARVLASYASLADTAADVTKTDIVPARFPALLALANRVKSATRSSLSIDSSGIPDFDQYRPDWAEVRAVVKTAIQRSNPATSPSPTPGRTATAPRATSGATATPTVPAGGADIQSDLDTTCAWDPTAAAANLKAWQDSWSSRYNDDGTRR